MTIIEAIKSGRPFKRADGNTCYSTSDWLALSGNQIVTLLEGYLIDRLGVDDILADDWEVREE